MKAIRAYRLHSAGFTLVEMIVTLAVAAIIAMIALPNFRNLIANARRDSIVDSLVASLHYTRNQALDLDQNTTLCAGVSGINGTPTGANPTVCATDVWANGWDVITVPGNGNPANTLTTHALPASSTAPTLKAVNGNLLFTFNGRGLIPSLTGNELLVVCDSRGASMARAVEVSSTGYIQSSPQPGTAPDGTTALTCP
ncbi:GspH/FimT family pseudopilin [Dyella silvatica]|uniref:GspH/FimT family pseudopilin n=1 Tax=Dyella silvatica TaxID=2992128 RepID=UPI00224F3FDA|nr:GspH/FimT family pseudopilin [Dyella silvatica]